MAFNTAISQYEEYNRKIQVEVLNSIHAKAYIIK